MAGRSPLIIKKKILSVLADNKIHTYAELERKVRSNWLSIRQHCTELEIFNCVIIQKKDSHLKNNKPYFEINITKEGLEILEKLKKEIK
ncbi:hypothetical protein K9M74_05325 [Candidatus Woesearchaeota archaeon]|nr:hypothetical protein [Candidatus Woesearchaeota archaeon]